MRIGDVFEFRYSQEYIKENNIFSPYHCFDGTLVANEEGGGIVRVGTYWSGCNKTFNPDNIESMGTLTFLFNSDEVDSCSKDDFKYYDSEDVFTMSIHMGYRNNFFIKKGAKRSKDTMLEYLRSELEKQKLMQISIERDIKGIIEKIERVEEGDVDIYI